MRSLAGAAYDFYAQVERFSTIDELHERLAAAIEKNDWTVIFLGASDDETPLFACKVSEGDKRLVLLGGSPGESVISPGLVSFLMEQKDEFEGWEVWAIISLDAARLRLNETCLNPRLSPGDYVRACRRAWGPGEDPEANLPLDSVPFWQPDVAPDNPPDDFVASSSESVALARALMHIKPNLMVVFKEILAGGISLAISQELEISDLELLVASTSTPDLPLHGGAKLRPGRQLLSHPGMVALPSLEEEMRRVEGLEDASDQLITRHVGGITSWQFLQANVADCLYLEIGLPRFSSTDFASIEASMLTRSIMIECVQRERGGKTVPFSVTRLNHPENPAHGKELRAEEIKGDVIPEAREVSSAPMSSGGLAIEAFYTRKHTLQQVIDIIEKALPALQGTEYIRSLQLLRTSQEGQENLLKSYQQNKRYGKQAIVAEVAHWHTAYALETIAILGEARHGIAREDTRDLDMQAAITAIDVVIDLELEKLQKLSPVAPARLAEVAAGGLASILAIAASGRPAVMRAQMNVDSCKKQVLAARKQVRELKNMRRPRPERELAETAYQQAQEDLSVAELELETKQQALNNSTEETSTAVEEATAAAPEEDTTVVEEEAIPLEEDTTVAPATDSQNSGDIDSGDSDPQAEVAEAVPVVETPDDISSLSEDEPEPNDINDIQESEEDSEDSSERIELTDELHEILKKEGLPESVLARLSEEGVPPDLIEYLKPESVGSLGAKTADDSTGESDPEAESDNLNDSQAHSDSETKHDSDTTDIEALLPRKLPLDPEWGRGSLSWESQVMIGQELPFVKLIQKLSREPMAAQDRPREKIAPPTKALAVSEKAEEISITTSQVGFRRRRLELTPRPRDPLPQLRTPNPTGGNFRPRSRHLAK